ncbi:MAG TPA: oligosaccharide flippase family protein, partial [Chitinophagaceae bacterium]|nr:oligosaccharide flippase family protein [Chitinophagaceae bacterium]
TIFATIQTARISLIRSAFIRFMNQTGPEEHQSLQASAFAVSMIISLFIAALFLVLAPYVSNGLNAPGLDTMLRWGALTILVSTISSQCEMTLTATLNFKAVSFQYLVRQGAFLAVVCFYWFSGYKLTATSLSVYHLLSIILSTFIALNSTRAILKLGFKNYQKWMPQLWHYGKYIFGTNVSAQAFRSADAFLTSAVFSPALSALYNASNRISNLVDLPSQVLADVAFTKASKIDNTNKAAVRNMYEKTTGAIMVFSLPALLFILCFPELVLHVLAGKEFVKAAPILRITAFFGFILPFLKQYGTIMDATGFPQINFRTNLLAFFLNITFNYIGLKLFGYLGAAIGTAVTYTCIFLTTQRILHKKFGVRVWLVFVNMFSFYIILFNMARSYTLRLPLARKA